MVLWNWAQEVKGNSMKTFSDPLVDPQTSMRVKMTSCSAQVSYRRVSSELAFSLVFLVVVEEEEG